MKFFVRDNNPPVRNYREIQRSVDDGLRASAAYGQHLQAIADCLPAVTRSFVLAPWYRDPRSHDCPHDAWLLDLAVRAEVDRDRTLAVNITLLGAYHDRVLEFEYSNVIDLHVDIRDAGGMNVGDWLADEFDVDRAGLVSHEIQWEHGAPWRILARKVRLSIRDYKPDPNATDINHL